jgi:hypothetical protein
MSSSRLGEKGWSTVIFEEVEQLNASRQKIQRPVLDVLANTSAVVLKPKRLPMLARVLRAHGADPLMG